MKISTGGIGTVATAQACNAKSAYPYQWAWDATKETADSIVSGQTFSDINQQDLSIVPTGVKVTFSGENAAYMDFHDENALGISGQLNALDTPRAKYLHGVFDFTNAGSEIIAQVNLGGTPTKSTAGEVGTFDMYWFKLSGTGAYSGSTPIAAFGTLARAVLVWDMTNPDTHPARYVDAALGGSTWETLTGESPFRLEFYTDICAASSYYIMNGYALSDRILSDIPLPIRTHMG